MMKFSNLLNKLTFIKILTACLIASSIFIIAAIAAIGSILLAVNSNSYNNLITKKFAEITGRSLNLAGGIKLQIFTNLNLHIGNTSIANPGQFRGGDFVKFESLNASIALLPLLKGTIRFNSLAIDGLKLDFITNTEINNWSFTDNQYDTARRKGNSWFNLELKNIKLTKASISYKNTASHNSYADENFLLIAAPLADGIIDIRKNRINFNNIQFNLDNRIYATLKLLIEQSDIESTNTSYQGDFKINNLSLPKLLAKTKLEIPPGIKTSNLSKISITSHIQGDAYHTKLDNLKLQTANSTISGNIQLGYKPLHIKQNLALDKIYVNEYIKLDGFKLKLESVSLIGALNGIDDSLTNTQGAENLAIQRITLYGFDIAKFTMQLNKAIKGMSTIKKLTTTIKTRESLKYIKTAIEKLQDQDSRNYKDTSNLGHLNAKIAIKNQHLTTPELNLNGPNLKGWSNNGDINLKTRRINYNLTAQIISPHEQTFINYIYFPYSVTGRFSNIKANLDFSSVSKQIIDYYNTSEKDKPILRKIFHW